ncbi:hypothetical protein CANCADRAFT_59207 [Tortispora caseinolytica NRRL Y-17796]|uniref:Uncharacterized protein n=1 Tax=Tortispora caseinolytica NRRL Y-17796 TaxID=767744 RepID=A0A1E4TJF4_9ASCO|nr:hypothetical protein CANCADRAFT_59207 [Tortispora caseinolytica NRRL Y-17796]
MISEITKPTKIEVKHVVPVSDNEAESQLREFIESKQRTLFQQSQSTTVTHTSVVSDSVLEQLKRTQRDLKGLDPLIEPVTEDAVAVQSSEEVHESGIRNTSSSESSDSSESSSEDDDESEEDE